MEDELFIYYLHFCFFLLLLTLLLNAFPVLPLIALLSSRIVSVPHSLFCLHD